DEMVGRLRRDTHVGTWGPASYSCFPPVSDRLSGSLSHRQPAGGEAHHNHEQADQARRDLPPGSSDDGHLNPSTLDGPSPESGHHYDGADRYQGRLGDPPSIHLGRLVRHALRNFLALAGGRCWLPKPIACERHRSTSVRHAPSETHTVSSCVGVFGPQHGL